MIILADIRVPFITLVNTTQYNTLLISLIYNIENWSYLKNPRISPKCAMIEVSDDMA